MKPVEQTVLGDQGNCFEACVASLLEIPLEDCNIFPDGVGLDSEADKASGRHWWIVFQEWLRLNHKRHPIYIMFSEMGGDKPKGYSIISGPGPRGLLHSTVGLDGEVAHDPHPSKAGLVSVRDYILFIQVK